MTPKLQGSLGGSRWQIPVLLMRALRSLAPTVEVRGRRIRIRPTGVAGADSTAINRQEAALSSPSSGMLLPAMVLQQQAAVSTSSVAGGIS